MYCKGESGFPEGYNDSVLSKAKLKLRLMLGIFAMNISDMKPRQ